MSVTTRTVRRTFEVENEVDVWTCDFCGREAGPQTPEETPRSVSRASFLPDLRGWVAMVDVAYTEEWRPTCHACPDCVPPVIRRALTPKGGTT